MLEAAWAHNKRQLITEALKIANKTVVEIGYLDDFNSLLQYIIITIDFSHDDLMSIIRNEIPERREDIMTIAEELREKGKIGGIREGIKEGKKQEKIEIVKNMLNIGIEIEKIAKATNLEKEQINIIKEEIKH